MVKKIKKIDIENGIIIFVEGDTEKIFYEKFIKYCDKSINKNIIIKNVKGIGNYQLKMISIIKNEIKVFYPNTNFSVVLCYDTDVFEYSPKPPINWIEIEKKIKKECNINNVIHIKAEKMIEDWFIIDIKGLCKYLEYSQLPNLKGSSGFEKMKNLFRNKNKIYLKGSYCYKFLDYLDFNILYKKLENILKPLKDLIEKNLQ